MNTNMPLRVLVTGAGSGIGAGLAGAFARDGFRVVVTDCDRFGAETCAGDLVGRGYDACATQLDVSDAAAVARVMGAMEPVDVLINNAGFQHLARLEEFAAQRWDQLLSVLLSGPANLMRAVLPGMRRRGFGRIVNIGSIHALVASPFKSAYVSAKHGLLGLAKVAALENADVDITVNTICPAYVRTPLVGAQIAAQAKEHGISADAVIDRIMLAPMPKRAFIEVEEIYALAAYLVSAAARNVTAQAIAIDGGWTAQ